MAIKHIHGGGGLSSDVWRQTSKGSPIAIDVDFGQIEACMKRCREMLPKIRAKSWARAVGTLHRQLQSAIGSGGNPSKGVPKFAAWDDFTRQFFEGREKKRGEQYAYRKIGRVLADKNHIVAYERRSFFGIRAEQVFGWPDFLRDVAIKFQDGGDSYAAAQLADKGWRHYVHSFGVKEIPLSYKSVPRPVLEPFKNYAVRKIKEWADAMIHKRMAQMIASATRKVINLGGAVMRRAA